MTDSKAYSQINFVQKW